MSDRDALIQQAIEAGKLKRYPMGWTGEQEYGVNPGDPRAQARRWRKAQKSGARKGTLKAAGKRK